MKEDNIKTLYDPKNGDRWKKYKKAADIIGYAVRQSRLDSKLKERAALISKCATNLQFAESSITGTGGLKKRISAGRDYVLCASGGLLKGEELIS